MKLTNQVCSLAQAKKLKELGIVQEGYFCYSGDGLKTDIKLTTDTDAQTRSFDPQVYNERISAFTVAELCAMVLCEEVEKSGYNTHYADGFFKVLYRGQGFARFTKQAEAIAYVLILLIEKGITTPEKCNQRLLND